jgi:hypothetical protein
MSIEKADPKTRSLKSNNGHSSAMSMTCGRFLPVKNYAFGS